MSKKVMIISVVIVLVAAVVGGTLFFLFKNSNINIGGGNQSSFVDNPGSQDAETINGSTVYNDDSGFSFEYPSDFAVADITPVDDNSYYSLLEIKKADDVIRVSVKDGSYKIPIGAVAIATMPSATSASGSATLKLGDFKPKQYTYEDNGVMKTLTLAISQGVSYAIDGVTANDDEETTYNTLVASFILGKRTSAPSAGGSNSNTVDEGEEVVQ